MRTLTIFFWAFLIFLLALILLDLAMIVSLLRTGDERRQLIVWKASTGTLLIVVLSLVIDIIESVMKNQAMENKIKIKRKELGISQEELAKQCKVSRQTINAIENNKYDPTLSLAFSLARELGVTVGELFTGE